MKDQLISFETAKLAKEKSFDLNVLHFYCKNSTMNYLKKPYEYSFRVNANHKDRDNFGYGKTCSAPTQSLLQKWLRDKHNLYVEARKCKIANKKIMHQYYIDDINNNAIYHKGFNIISYELALEKGLQKALKLINKV